VFIRIKFPLDLCILDLSSMRNNLILSSSNLNGVFAEIGQLASDEVFLQLICQKCMSVLLYGLEVCSFIRNIISLDC